ncbi:MAG: hypothetical protein ACOX6V_02920 [Patescibacteria group bacterium]|jgi:hypothetical protein
MSFFNQNPKQPDPAITQDSTAAQTAPSSQLVQEVETLPETQLPETPTPEVQTPTPQPQQENAVTNQLNGNQLNETPQATLNNISLSPDTVAAVSPEQNSDLITQLEALKKVPVDEVSGKIDEIISSMRGSTPEPVIESPQQAPTPVPQTPQTAEAPTAPSMDLSAQNDLNMTTETQPAQSQISQTSPDMAQGGVTQEAAAVNPDFNTNQPNDSEMVPPTKL